MSNYYITGDTHGDQILWDASLGTFLKPADTIIVAGDFGVGFFDGRFWPEETFLDYFEEQEYTILFCDGNHENFDKLNGYPVSEWHGGRVHYVRKNVIHLMRGEVFEIDGKRVFVMGGGYSIDKPWRVPGRSWWPQEMPDDAEYRDAASNLKKAGFEVDYILTHTAPRNTVEYMSRLSGDIRKQVDEELPLTGFLQWVADETKYRKWYFGHFHIDAELWKDQYAVYHGIREFHSGKLVRMRA